MILLEFCSNTLGEREVKEKKRKKMIMGLERQTVLTLTPVADSKTVSNLPQKKLKMIL